MMVSILSIIIPCYNSGEYLPDTLNSISKYLNNDNYEIIIINDGSDDENTVRLLRNLSKQNGYIVIDQENKGVAAARNAGVKIAKSPYLLMLDSDNLIRGNYIEKGVEILNKHPEVSVVHGKPFFFGDTTDSLRLIETGEFDLNKIIASNYIDNCAVIRKTMWETLGGQDECREIMSHADWDFWIRAGAAGYNFFFIDEIVFDYRVRGNSLVDDFSKPGGIDPILKYIYAKHAALINQLYFGLYIQFNFYKFDQQKPFRSFLKFFVNKYLRNIK